VNPMLRRRAAQLDSAFAHRAQLFDDALGGVVVRMDEARDAAEWKVREQPVARRARRLGREPLAPERPVERVGDLRLRPVERLEDADATDEHIAVAGLARPHAIPAQRPAAEIGGHGPPHLDAGVRPALREIAHHLGDRRDAERVRHVVQTSAGRRRYRSSLRERLQAVRRALSLQAVSASATRPVLGFTRCRPPQARQSVAT
jgi:hypothetical protein